MAGSGRTDAGIQRPARRAAGTTIVATMVVVALAAACAPPTPSVEGPKAFVPAVPAPATRSFVVDPALVERWACDACAGAGAGAPDGAAFFYGILPARSVDELFHGEADDRSALLGNLFLSGWFGGLYLRANLVTTGAGGSAGPVHGGPDPVSPSAGDEVRDLLFGALGGGTIAMLDGIVGELVRTAERGSHAQVRSTAWLLGPLMAAVHGYNLGYLQVALERPPPGASSPVTLGCDPSVDPVFDCRSGELPLPALDSLAPSLARLAAPPDVAWQWWSEAVTGVALGSVGGGRAVWEGLLDGSVFSTDGYAAIVELSRGFLQVTQATVLALSEGAVGDVEVGRRGLLVAAALVSWAGSYFAGLAAPGGDHELPTLDCGTDPPAGAPLSPPGT